MTFVDRFNGYKRTGNRISLLDVSRYCGLAAKLGEANTAVSRAAEVSSVFHAIGACVGQEWPDDLKRRYALLSEGEQAEIMGWKLPAPVEVAPGIVLDYAQSTREELVGIDELGNYVDPTKQDVLGRGDVDAYWVIPEWEGARVLAVADMKKSKYTTSAGPDTLQTATYGFALANKHDCDAFVTGLWYLQEGEWNWSEHFVDLSTSAAARLWDRCLAALTHRTSTATYGDHCTDCWERQRCEAWVLPAFIEERDIVLDPERPETLATAALAAKAMGELSKRILDNVKAIAKDNPNLRITYNSKEFKPRNYDGKESVAAEDVRKAFGAEAEKVIKKGRPYQAFSWVKR